MRAKIMRDVQDADAARKEARRQDSNFNRGRCTITLRNRANDERITVVGMHEDGPRAAFLSALAPYPADEWQLLSHSTPRTILADLRVRRGGVNMPTPEQVICGQAKCPEYLAPDDAVRDA